MIGIIDKIKSKNLARSSSLSIKSFFIAYKKVTFLHFLLLLLLIIVFSSLNFTNISVSGNLSKSSNMTKSTFTLSKKYNISSTILLIIDKVSLDSVSTSKSLYFTFFSFPKYNIE